MNLVIHRDYSIRGSEIHVDICQDKLKIISPGSMLDGFKIQDLDIDNNASKRRNPVLYDAFYRLKLMECRGSGLRKIGDFYNSELAPEFRSTPQAFIVVLKNLNYGNTSMTNIIDDVIEDTSERII